MLYWDKKIVDLKAKTIKDIPKILTKLDNIFENMKKSKFPISDKEKLKYAYNTFPPGFRSKFEFNVNKTYKQLCERIKYNITMKPYAGEWNNNNEDTNSNKSDDPMEIDALHKRYKRFTKTDNNNNNNNNKYNESKYKNDKQMNHKSNNKNYNKNNQKEKFCLICEKHGHTLKECWRNLKNPNRKNNGNSNNGKFMGYINDIQLSNEYNNGFNYHELHDNLEKPNDDTKSINFINKINNPSITNENLMLKHKNTRVLKQLNAIKYLLNTNNYNKD